MDTVHPLLLPNVLSSIFQCLTSEELEIIRLVSLDFNHTACTMLQKQKLILIESLTALQNYISVFTRSPEVLQAFPHSIFHLHFKIPDEETFDMIKFFISKFQYQIRNLTITLGTGFMNINHLKFTLENLPCLETIGIKFHYFNCPQLEESLDEQSFKFAPIPSLKSIALEIESYESCWVSATNLLTLIFQSAKNVNRISHPRFCIPITRCRIPSKMNIFLTDLISEEETLERKGILQKLSYLEFIGKLNEKNIQVLLEMKYPLKQVYINLGYPDDEEECVSPFSLKLLMSQLAPTLEKLGLDFPWRKEVAFEFKFQLPMRNLVYLSLSGFQGSLLSLLDKLPNLVNIEISQVDLYEILPSAQNADVYSNVKTLRVDFCTNQTPGMLSRLSRIFPSLRKLDINHTTNEVVRMIFQKMLSLISLRLQGDELEDEGISGIPKEIAKENNLSVCSIEKGDSLRKYSFIGNLPNLRYLKLEAYQLTEDCIKHGIVHCSTLHFVSMDTRLGSNDPSSTVTRTFRLSEHGRKLQGKEATLILREEPLTEEDEDAEDFFRKYEKGMATDLLFV